MRIIAPSYKRVKGVLTHLVLPEVSYAVHEFEADEYKAAGYQVIVIPDELKGNIARVRNWIKRMAWQEGEFVIIDDDIASFQYWQDSKAVKLVGDHAMEHIESMCIVAKDFGSPVFGVNPASDKGGYREYTPFSTTSYCSGSFHAFVLPTICEYDEDIPLKEDYDYTIQLCNIHRIMLRFNQYHLIKNDHGNVGGCADYRTMSREREQMGLFQRKWGRHIVREDTRSKGYDINPIIKIPIKGV